jgi:hypothetical protein
MTLEIVGEHAQAPGHAVHLLEGLAQRPTQQRVGLDELVGTQCLIGIAQRARALASVLCLDEEGDRILATGAQLRPPCGVPTTCFTRIVTPPTVALRAAVSGRT